jgi:hypothetical protein
MFQDERQENLPRDMKVPVLPFFLYSNDIETMKECATNDVYNHQTTKIIGQHRQNSDCSRLFS